MYNLAVMKLAENKPEEAFNLIGHRFPDSNNARIAQKRIEAKRVTKPASVGAFNPIHFRKAKKLEFKPFQRHFVKEPVLEKKKSDWESFMVKLNKFKLQEELKFSSDKKFFYEIL